MRSKAVVVKDYIDTHELLQRRLDVLEALRKFDPDLNADQDPRVCEYKVKLKHLELYYSQHYGEKKYRQSKEIFDDPEEAAMRDDNMKARAGYQEENVRSMMAMVALYAVKDYRKKHRKLKSRLNKLNIMRQYNPKLDADNDHEVFVLREEIAEIDNYFASPIFTEMIELTSPEEIKRRILTAPDTLDITLDRKFSGRGTGRTLKREEVPV